MELRSALAKKKRIEQEAVGEIVADVRANVDVFVHDMSDMITADRIQQEELLYPMDALVLAAAEDEDATLATFDAELQDAGVSSPAELLA
jgi:predicted nucleic acid-binding protein